jgi:SAM-dependent methyltransferase
MNCDNLTGLLRAYGPEKASMPRCKGGESMTASWTSGYISDVEYTLGFYRELAPTYLNFACLMNGVEGPDLNRPLRYAELGCGRGYGTVLLAASNPNIEFLGIDFNPSHIAEARSLAERAKIPNVTFLEMSFADAAESNDPKLSNFDIVVLHGIYTWVERSVREDIHRFLLKKLLAGGLVYNSYNTQPGWATVGPIQQLVMEVARRSPRDSLAVIGEAQELLKSLIEHSSAFIVQNPGVKARVEGMAQQDRAYLAHEFVNSGWEPIYVTEVMKNFGEAKLTYIGSASLTENRIDLCVPKNLQDLVRKAPDAGMRELLKDYAINKQFRRDLYVRGPQRLSNHEQRRRLNQTPFISLLMSGQLPEKIKIPLGEISISKEITQVILNTLGDGVATGGDIIAAAQQKSLNDRDVVMCMLLLVGAGFISPAYPARPNDTSGSVARLNQTIMRITAASDTHRFLASSATGSAIKANFLDRIIALSDFGPGGANDVDIAHQTFDMLEAEGQVLRRDGEPIKKTDSEIEAIAKLVSDFREHRLPRWRALGVI